MANISLPGVPAFTWQSPVIDPSYLPTEGNQLGDARAVLSVNDIFMFDGSAWVSVAAGGTVTAVSASLPLSSTGGSAPNLSIPKSDATTNGYLAQADFSLFNGKQSALTFGNLSDVGTDGILITGGTGAVIGSGTSLAQQSSDSTRNGYLSSVDWSTFNAKQSASYTPGDSGDWANPQPTTIQEAIDRIAAVVGGVVPIP